METKTKTTDAEWMDIARQHDKNMTLRQVKVLYGAEAARRVLRVKNLSGHESTVDIAELMQAVPLLWDVISLGRTTAQRAALCEAHSVIAAICYGSISIAEE